MSTPGRRKALKALARAKKANLRRVAKGQKPVMGGKRVSLSTFAKKTGVTKKKAQKRLAAARKR